MCFVYIYFVMRVCCVYIWYFIRHFKSITLKKKQNIFFIIFTDPMFWGKIFLFYRPTDRKIFLLLPVEQLINLEWPCHCKQWSRSNLPQIFNENKQLNDLLEQLIKPPLWVIPNIESNTSLSIFSFQHGVNHTQTHTHISILQSYFVPTFLTPESSSLPDQVKSFLGCGKQGFSKATNLCFQFLILLY